MRLQHFRDSWIMCLQVLNINQILPYSVLSLFKKFARISAPLNDLISKDGFYDLKQDHKDAFDLLNLLLISSPILSHPDYNL